MVTKESRAERVSDTVEFKHHRITTTLVTPEDRVIRSIEQLVSVSVLKGDKLSATEAQMKVIETLQRVHLKISLMETGAWNPRRISKIKRQKRWTGNLQG